FRNFFRMLQMAFGRFNALLNGRAEFWRSDMTLGYLESRQHFHVSANLASHVALVEVASLFFLQVATDKIVAFIAHLAFELDEVHSAGLAASLAGPGGASLLVPGIS